MTPRASRYILVGCLPYSQSPPCFALPIFSDSGSNSGLYTQEVDEINKRILRLVRVENVTDRDLRVLKRSYRITNHQIQIYVFLTEEDEIVGPLSHISADLRDFVKRNPDKRDIIFQIMELIGEKEEKKIARAGARSWVRKFSNESAAHLFYDVGVLNVVFWDILLTYSPNDAVSRRILDSRGRLSARINKQFKIKQRFILKKWRIKI